MLYFKCKTKSEMVLSRWLDQKLSSFSSGYCSLRFPSGTGRWKRVEAPTHFGPKSWPALGKNNTVRQPAQDSPPLHAKVWSQRYRGRRVPVPPFASIFCIYMLLRDLRRRAECGPELPWPQSIFLWVREGYLLWVCFYGTWLGALVLGQLEPP